MINLKIAPKIILYTIALAMAVLLLRYTYRDASWQELKVQLQQVRMRWIILAIGMDLVGHLIKAYRWTLLLKPIGFQSSLLQSLQALLVGYLSTLLVPRVGELVRCSFLNRTTGVPLGVLLGTSVLERLLSGLGFLMIVFFSLLVSFPAIAAAFQTIPFPSIDPTKLSWGIGGFVIVFATVGYMIYTKDESSFLRKLQPFANNLTRGFTSIRLSPIKKSIALLTLLEWGSYYGRDYIGVFALQGYEHFDWAVGLAILTMSTISFGLPVQGGLGAYHLLVSSVLVTYGVPANSALLYAGVMHSAHFIGILILGLVVFSLIKLKLDGTP